MVYFLGHPVKLSDYDANVFLFWGIDLTTNVCLCVCFFIHILCYLVPSSLLRQETASEGRRFMKVSYIHGQ